MSELNIFQLRNKMTANSEIGIGLTNLQPPIPTYAVLKNSHNFTVYILRKLCFIYFLQLSTVSNIIALFSSHPYISRCTALSGSHFVYVLCTACSIGITLTKYKCNPDFVQQEPMTSCNISPTIVNNYTQLTWHTDTNPNPAAKLPISLSSNLQKTRHFQRTNLNPYLPKML